MKPSLEVNRAHGSERAEKTIPRGEEPNAELYRPTIALEIYMPGVMFLSFLLYVAIVLSIGLMSYRRMRSEGDFVLGGRSMNFWITALSAHASDMSSWMFMGLPVMIYLGGVREIWISLGLLVGMALTWQFIAPKLRVETEKNASYTLPSFLCRRFNDQKGILSVLTTGLTLFFMTFYLASGAMSTAMILEALFDVPYLLGIAIALVIVVLYTIVGGYIAIAWTDCFQALFLLFTVLFVPFSLYLGGTDFTAIQAGARLRGISLDLLPEFTFEWISFLLLTAFGWGLGYFGMPHVLTKFMGLKDPQEMKKSKWVGLSWQFLALGGASLVGLFAIGLFPTLADPQLLFLEEVFHLFSPFIAGFIICAIIAANISTMDSQLLVCASSLSEDVVHPFVGEKWSQEKLLLASRVAVLLTALVAFLIAAPRSASIQDVVQYAWSGLGCTFGPLVLAALYLRSLNIQGAVASLTIGALFAIGWPLISMEITGHNLPATLPGFFFSLLAIYLLSPRDESSSLKNRAEETL